MDVDCAPAGGAKSGKHLAVSSNQYPNPYPHPPRIPGKERGTKPSGRPNGNDFVDSPIRARDKGTARVHNTTERHPRASALGFPNAEVKCAF
jgi:hypothetical protein